jgi:hypothetical protein
MIYLYYSDSKEKDLVEGWAKYGTKMGFTTYTSSITGYETVSNDRSTDCIGVLQCCTSTDTCSKNVFYDAISTTNNPGKLTVNYSNTTVTQSDTSSLYPWNYVKSNSWTPIESNYIVDPLQLETEHRKVKQIIKFKPI